MVRNEISSQVTDNCALGDWVVDTEKLPDGIEGLLRDAKNQAKVWYLD